MRWVITGANRGIGLELVRQLADRGDAVEALARATSPALSELVARAPDRVRAITCDITTDASVRAAVAAIGSVAVDVVVNNAGVMGKMQSLHDLDLEDVVRTFDVNALGAIRVTRALLPLLLRADTRRVVSITSGMGSIEDNTHGGAYGYRMSKAALNMANRSMSVDLAHQRVTCVVMNPGWVQTEMGGEGAPTPVAESASRMIGIIDELTLAQSGTFLDYRGGTIKY
ncbi:MAG: SDR family oxidoreductase [Polyangiaceae bacterium]|nr:SDR family oxidoreductase [Polyangiaceae bacterium]